MLPTEISRTGDTDNLLTNTTEDEITARLFHGVDWRRLCFMEGAWCHLDYLLKNMETLNRLPWAAQSAVFQKLESIADVSGMTRAERLQYDEALKKYRDTISVFEGVRMEGRMEGRKEGIIANARKMKSYGFTLEMIADITGLTIEEVRDL